MRPIRFRAWIDDSAGTHDYDGMYEWDPAMFTTSSPVTEYTDAFPDADDESVTLMQYMGIKDSAGREMCEGDICVMNILGGELSEPTCAWRVLIEFHDDALAFGFVPVFPHLVHEDDRGWRSFWDSEDRTIWKPEYFRVIGNIYENPELLLEQVSP